MGQVVLYHGSNQEIINPKHYQTELRHDLGNGFYLVESKDIAKQFAVCCPNNHNGYLHQYHLDITDLKILDFTTIGILPWLAQLYKNRNLDLSKRQRLLVEKFVKKYGIDTTPYDVIKGWRSDASYFYIAKEFIQDNVDVELLDVLINEADYAVQYCIQSELAYSKLIEVNDGLEVVDYQLFNDLYKQNDLNALSTMRCIVNSEANKVENV